MYFLIIQLFRQEYKEDLFLAFTSCGIKNATFIEGFNLDKVLREEFSLFTGFVRTKEERERYALLVTAVVDGKDTVKELLHIIKESGIAYEKEDILRMTLIPASMVKDRDVDWEADERPKAGTSSSRKPPIRRPPGRKSPGAKPKKGKK